MSQGRIESLLSLVCDTADRGQCRLWSDATGVDLADLARSTSLECAPEELAGRSVLLVTLEQASAAQALVELDGVAARLVVCPPDVTSAELSEVISRAAVDAIVSDDEVPLDRIPAGILRVRCGRSLSAARERRAAGRKTEWVLLSSGTSTGTTKMIVHSLASLTAPIAVSARVGSGVVWGTFYDIRRYGGLQIFLRLICGGGSLVLSRADEPVAGYLSRLAAHGVTHLSGTPSHWRRALMNADARRIAPHYVRLSGEIADQGILNMLRTFYPDSIIAHAFASTEAGVAFEVNDGLAGFPTTVPGRNGSVEIKIENGSLRIRSDRTASRYLNPANGPLADADGFVDTGDMVELRGDRYQFLGRRNGVINVGGMKVHPEEVEAVINRHPAVRGCVVRSRRNPVTGALVSADVVLRAGNTEDDRQITDDILAYCKQNLAPHKVPVTVRCVPDLEIASGGKVSRAHA